MLFFWSEEAVREWCRSKNSLVRPLVTIDQLWNLAVTWYSTRLHVDSRRPKPEEMREIFSSIGLVNDFWDPGSDQFD